MSVSSRLSWELANTKWAAEINPIIDNPVNSMSIIENVPLVIGANVINHLLGHTLTGWTILRKRAACNVYDTQDSNASPDLTLQLVSDAIASVDIGVF